MIGATTNPQLHKQNSFFYNATIKHPTAITKSFKCHFTSTDEKVEENLVTICSNTINIYTLEEHSIELKLNSQFNDKIVECIPIPVPQPQRSARKREIENAISSMVHQQMDYLFVLTQNFNCALIYYSQDSDSIEVVSRGNLSEKGTGEKRERPFPIFLGGDGKFIVLMLYENVIKVIPLVQRSDSSFPIQLSNAINLRIRHSDVTDVIPIYSEKSTDPIFAILYQRMEHSVVQGRSVKRVRREIEKTFYDQAKGDLTSKNEKLILPSNTVYRIVSLEFGGFLAFDIDQLAYSCGDFKQPLIYRKLRTPLTVTAICQVDQYDKNKGRTKDGLTFMRYLLATEAGELFMLAFQLELLGRPDQESRFIVLEFLASELSSASSITYLDNSYVFYASSNSDSYILQVTSDLQPDLKKPFCKIIQTFESLAPVVDMTLATPNIQQGGQSELLITSGLNHSTFMSLVKKGIQLNTVFNFASLGLSQVSDVFASKDTLIIKCFDYEMPLCLKTTSREVWDGQDLPRSTCIKGDLLGFTKINRKVFEDPNANLQGDITMKIDQTEQQEELIVLATTTKLSLFNENWELKQEVAGAFTHFLCMDSSIIVVETQKITVYAVDQQSLKLGVQFVMDAPVSAICGNKVSSLLYVCVYDSPFYTLSVLNSTTLQKIQSISLTQFLDITHMRSFFNKKAIVEDKVFSPDLPVAMETDQYQVTCPTQSVACLSIEHLQIEDVDTLICGFGNGKILKLHYHINSAAQLSVLEQAEEAVNQANADELGRRYLSMDTAFFGAQVYFVGSILPKLKKITTENGLEAVIGGCDKPVVFYQEKEKVEIQYLASGLVSNVEQIQNKMVYLNEKKELCVGMLDNLQKLQINRMLFKKQITKSLLLPKFDSIGVLLEEPDLAYLDETKNAVNLIALVSRSTIQVKSVFKLNKTEVSNCLIYNQHEHPLECLIVGTTFVKHEEQVPSAGRLLLFDPQTLNLIQEFKMDGSVQSITFDGKVLAVAVNNKVRIYTITQNKQQRDQPFVLELLDQKQTGTFIHSLTPLGSNSLIVADMAGSGICTFDLVAQRHGKVKLAEAASSHFSLWTNQVVAISSSQFIVFDQNCNMLIFEKHPEPITLEQKYKLQILGSFCINEEVKSAAFGSLRVAQQSQRNQKPTAGQEEQKQTKRLHYIQQIQKSEVSDVEMKAVEDCIVFDENAEILIRTDVLFARKMFTQALAQIEHFSQQQIMYGTAEGSIGTLFRVPYLCYYILNMLSCTMDKLVNQDLTLVRRSEYRQVKSVGIDSGTNHQSVLDGDFIEQFINLPKVKQLEIAKKMMSGQTKGDEQMTSILLQILQEFVKLH